MEPVASVRMSDAARHGPGSTLLADHDLYAPILLAPVRAPPSGLALGATGRVCPNPMVGSWSEEAFVKAIKTGRHMGVSRPILPPMPWQFFATEEDLGAMYAYLRTVPPIHNRIPEPMPPTQTQTTSP
jgi:hypothetical protein